MLRSLYSAVSGVKAHQAYLDVTGNNIANVNTVGFKRDVIQFRDMVYQMSQGASAPNSSIPIGGTNPAQVGLGVKVGSIETNHATGSLQSTGVSTDMAISGQGFFVVQNGGQQLFTRAGNFSLDANGNLVMSGSGYLVQGFAYTQQTDPATGVTSWVRDSKLSSINIPIGQKIAAKETTVAAFRCNLCSKATSAISDLNSIPGGSTKVQRPHTYTAYGAASATYVGDTSPLIAQSGNTWYDTVNGTLMYWDTSAGTGGWANYIPPVYGGEDTIYYGENSATGSNVFANTWYNATQGSGAVVSSRVTVDFAENGTPTSSGIQPTKAGQTYLDIQNGILYTANSTGTAWLPTTTAAAADTAYALRGANSVYVMDSTGILEIANGYIMDTSIGAKNLVSWNGASWTNINNVNGLSPSAASITDQDTIDAFGASMILSRSWSDKASVYDSLGNEYTVEVAFRKVLDRPADPTATPPTGAESEWDWYAYYVDADGKVLEQYGEGAGTLVFGDDGLLKRTYYYEATPASPTTPGTSTTQPVYNWSVVEKIIDTNDPNYNASIHDGLVTGKIVADFNTAGAAGSVTGTGSGLSYESNMITLDFLGDAISKVLGVEKGAIDGTTQYGSSSTNKIYYQDGYPMGELTDFTVGSDGIITGVYSNGQLLAISQLALATFANPQGLTKVGDTCFMVSSNSGIASIGTPGSGGAGTIVGSTIEMSNVDLSEEFVNLIRAQRGFQANTRVITTSDQVLEELINLKR